MITINNATELKNLLESLGYKLVDIGNYYRTKPLYRQSSHSGSLSINKRTGIFVDFGANNLSGDINKLIELTTGKSDFQIDFSQMDFEEKINLDNNVFFDPNLLENLIPEYQLYLDRGISKETLEKFNCGMMLGWKLNRRIIFPIKDNKNRIIGLMGRWFQEKHPYGKPSWKKLGKSANWNYPRHLNEDYIRKKKEIILLEGFSDALALWECGIYNFLCITGLNISSKQLSYLCGLDLDKIIIATNNEPDNDNIGLEAARKIKYKLTKLFNEDKIEIQLPPEKDFGVMLQKNGKQSIIDWYQSTL